MVNAPTTSTTTTSMATQASLAHFDAAQNLCACRLVQFYSCAISDVIGCQQVNAIHSISILSPYAVWKISNAITTFQTCTNSKLWGKFPVSLNRTWTVYDLCRTRPKKGKSQSVIANSDAHTHKSEYCISKIASSHPAERFSSQFRLPFDALSFETDAFDERVHLGLRFGGGWMSFSGMHSKEHRPFDRAGVWVCVSTCACVSLSHWRNYNIQQRQINKGHPTIANAVGVFFVMLLPYAVFQI